LDINCTLKVKKGKAKQRKDEKSIKLSKYYTIIAL